MNLILSDFLQNLAFIYQVYNTASGKCYTPCLIQQDLNLCLGWKNILIDTIFPVRMLWSSTMY